MKSIKFIIEKTKTGYSAYCAEKPIFTTGLNIYKLQTNALEATNLYLEEFGKKVSMDKIGFELDFQQFFEYHKVINAKHLAKRINMNETLLSQYVNGKKKPSKKQVDRILEGLHEMGRELMELSLV
ncbi:MAG: helix-turn-helix transcriptional regulator [Flavobacterium sp.]|jgi:transcriptional regulator with XRE-family HTH domain|nr:helix-turn-helix transcriptional regulator [Saprospiraceae bacterium]MBP6585904.1 helix-turn-helix transcriptional regulator [Flavobacterium sp.]